MGTRKRSDENFYPLLRRVLDGRATADELVSDPLFLDRGQRICNYFASGTSYGPSDLFQDVCVKLLKSGARLYPDNIPSEEAFFSWLSVLARNLRNDDLRKHGKVWKRGVSMDDILSEVLAIADPGVGPEVECLRGELDAFIETLPEKTRRAIALRQEGLTYDKVAEVLGVTNVTVRTWVLGALKAFEEGRLAPEVRKTVRKVI